MARIRTRKKESTEPVKESFFYYYIIIFLLLVQTAFLGYKNFEYIKAHFEKDPNAEFADEISKKASENILQSESIQMIDPSKIRVSILNGCGQPGLAGVWKEKLRNLRYDVRETGNASGNYNKTVILSRSEDMKYARHISKNIGVKDENVIMQINKDLVDIDVTVIIGADHKKLGN